MASKIGFHYSTGGNKSGIGGWIDYATQQGIPVGLKGVSDYGLIFEAIQKGNPGWFVYRLSAAAGSVSREVPNYTVDPVIDAEALAAETLSKLPPEFDRSKVWLELINEPRGKWTDEPVWGGLHPVDYLGEWCLAAAGYLNAQGYKFCGPGFNSGEPGDDGKPLSDVTAQYLQPGMRAYLQYCADNPNMAALAVHEYIWLGPIVYPGLWGRFEAAIAAADLAGIPRTFPIFITEWGFAPNNAPDMPAAVPYLDYYNKLAARFPQVKFAAAWTLQSGYDPVDDKIITWTQYPIDKAFDAGEQPAVTHTAFGGTLPDDTEEPMDNLLRHADFEGYETWDNIPTGQVPWEWSFEYYTGANPYDPASYVKPETRVILKAQLPAGEWQQFGLSGEQAVKVFKGGAPWHGSFIQTLSQPLSQPGKATIRFFADLVLSYGPKVYATYDPNNPAGQLRVNGSAWYLMRPGEINEATFDLPAGTTQLKIEWRCNYPLPNSAIFFDDPKLEYIDTPTGTWQEQAAKIADDTQALFYKKGASLQTVPTSHGFQVFGNEFDFIRPDGVKIRMRGAIHPVTAVRRYYWVPVPDWSNVQWYELGGGTQPDTPFKFAAYPVQGRPYTITSPFNAPRSYGQHEGIDLSAPMGQPILSVADGVVDYIRTSDTSGYGLYVRVKHSERFRTWYAHLQSVGVTVGQPVTAGQVLGLADSTGNSTGSHLHLTVQDMEQGLDGYVVAKVVDPKPFLDALTPPLPGISMPPYFLPSTGDYGDICILSNNWGQGSERQQLQRQGNLSYVTKNQNWERRRIAAEGIYLEMDTSPNENEYYTIEGSPWLPLSWLVGNEYIRSETVCFFRKSDCTQSQTPYSVTNKIKFAALHSSWTSPAGVNLSNVIELQWLIAGAVEETYHFAPGKGLVAWANAAGKKSWVTEIIPVGQQANNVREVIPCLN